LPAWLPDLELHGLRLGPHHLSIRFWREGEATAFEVLKGDKQIVERRSFAVGSGVTLASGVH
jgi:hypothetical protein